MYEDQNCNYITKILITFFSSATPHVKTKGMSVSWILLAVKISFNVKFPLSTAHLLNKTLNVFSIDFQMLIILTCIVYCM